MQTSSREAKVLRTSKYHNLSPSSITSPSHQPANRNFFSQIPLSTSPPPPSDPEAKSKPPQHYFDATTSPVNSNILYHASDIDIDDYHLLMPSSYDFHSTHSNNYPLSGSDGPDNVEMWHLGGGNVHPVANRFGVMPRAGHTRAPSSSSIGSVASISGSPFQGEHTRVHAHDQRAGKNGRYRDHSSRSHLPSPTTTPIRNNFFSTPSTLSHGQDINSAVASSLAMRHLLQDSNQLTEDDLPQMSHSQRPSFSGLTHDPATPMTLSDHREPQRIISNGENGQLDIFAWSDSRADDNTESMSHSMVPKLERTVSDALNDELYFPQEVTMSQSQSNPSYLMPEGNRIINDRLMAAQMARSASSGSNQSGALSPFRAGYGHDSSESHDNKYEMSPNTESEPKTISPKDAVLDYKPTSDDYPLFPQSTAGLRESYTAVAPSANRSSHYAHSNLGYGSLAASQAAWVSGLSQASLSSAPLQAYNSFAPPPLPSHMSMSGIPSIPATYMGSPLSHPRRTVSRQTNRTPEFPAQLASMESSASEAAPQSSAASLMMNSPKPESSADSGTYSCTYHGCIQRFTTPQKLQKHKRDTHRNNPNVTPGVGSGMSTAQLMERNSQSGPHKCDRINPTTGKSCSAIFSRPYDLTRHEDTIHNIRKQKVRCAICTEEKTFSRADALTRHMRVVHPEVDFPGKHTTRRKGSRGE